MDALTDSKWIGYLYNDKAFQPKNKVELIDSSEIKNIVDSLTEKVKVLLNNIHNDSLFYLKFNLHTYGGTVTVFNLYFHLT